jgi:hypothetical protein
MTRAQYVVFLSRALRTEKASPQIHALLTLLAQVKAAGDTISIAGVSIRLAISYHAILDHISARPSRGKSGKGNPHLFVIDPDRTPRGLTLSAEGEAFLARIEQLVARYARQAELEPTPTQPAG